MTGRAVALAVLVATERRAVAVCRAGADERAVDVVNVVTVVLVSGAGIALSGVGVGLVVVSVGVGVGVGCASCATAAVEESARAAAIAGRALVRAQSILVLVIMPKQRSCVAEGGSIIGSMRRPLDKPHDRFTPLKCSVIRRARTRFCR